MFQLLTGRETWPFLPLQSRKHFCDGFKIACGPYHGSLQLQRFLVDNGIDAKTPNQPTKNNFCFVQLKSAENDITKTLQSVRESYSILKDEMIAKGLALT